jgi:hypothetical protein
VVLLATVAVATAWSGYQAARWDGHEALLYQTSTQLRSEAGAANTTGGRRCRGRTSPRAGPRARPG